MKEKKTHITNLTNKTLTACCEEIRGNIIIVKEHPTCKDCKKKLKYYHDQKKIFADTARIARPV